MGEAYMNSKMLLAFAGGLIIASGVTYIAMKRSPAVPVEATAQGELPAITAARAKAKAAAAEPVAADAPKPDAIPEPEAAPPSKTRTAPPPRKPRFQPDGLRTDRATRVMHPVPPTPVNPPAQKSPVVIAQAPQTQPAAQPPAQEVAKAEPPPPYVPPSLPPPPAKPNTVTVPSGTMLTVRLGENLSTERNQPGDQFTAVLDQPLVVDGFVLAEKGSRAHGRIVELDRSGKVRGIAKLAIELTQIKTSDGQNVKINTSAFSKTAETTRNKDAAKVGAGALIGAAIGAMAGGGKGAAVGAGVGGAAGAGDVAMTRGQAAELRVETKVSFRLSEAVTLTERLQ
jgi:hypothetical protein